MLYHSSRGGAEWTRRRRRPGLMIGSLPLGGASVALALP